MSGYLWKYFFEDNVESFRHLLETSAYNARPGTQPRAQSQIATLGSPGSFGTSPTLHTKARRAGHAQGVPLTRLDINSRDNLGLTILHHAASSSSENALAFAEALLQHPLTDLYTQDYENGWTSLHRAFYFGNVAIARVILERDKRFVPGRTSQNVSQQAGSLVKIKDREGNGPFDLFGMTIQDRILNPDDVDETNSSDEAEEADLNDDDDDGFGFRETVRGLVNLQGDEFYTFGSNKNITLGFGDEDDRQNPEKIQLRRPDRLVHRFHREFQQRQARVNAALRTGPLEEKSSSSSNPLSVTQLPTVVRYTPLLIQDVQMSKLHTAVLTTDPESNLYMCGHGTGGRLGTGSEMTRFQFICVEGGALPGKKIVSIALGQNHTLAVSSDGETFSWGSNINGQLGYTLPKSNVKDEEPVQTLPRQIFGPLKREVVIGIAASRNHSVAHTSSSLYTFGRNEGQLGIMDSDARSLEVQITPRKIAASLFSSNIHSVSAIDRATICLLENHEVWVFANYGYSKVAFPLDGFANYFLKSSFLATKYERSPNRIVKVTSGGDSICAMSSSGEIFTVAVAKKTEAASDSNASTTNPAKIRSALSAPQCIWSAKKRHMAAKDVGVDHDGSIILVTEAGGVWRRTVRATLKDATASGVGEYKAKDYKFSRIPGLTRVCAVRSSAHGAYAAIRRDATVTRTQIDVESSTLWDNIKPLLACDDLAAGEESSDDENPAPRFWSRPSGLQRLSRRVLASKDLEKDIADSVQRKLQDTGNSGYDIEVGITSSHIRIPTHQFMLAARSPVLNQAFADVTLSHPVVIPEFIRVGMQDDGKLRLTFESIDFLTLFNLVLYVYTDTIVSFWQYARQSAQLAPRYRQTRIELMKLASRLELRQLEPAARQIVSPKPSMPVDFAVAIRQPSFFKNGDVLVQLEDGHVWAHSAMLCQRVPFFEAMFNGRTGGQWLAARRDESDMEGVVDVDLTHISKDTFQLVLRHIYADAEEEMFARVTSEDLNDHFALDELLDLVIEVMGVANELLMTRLSQICQRFVGRYVTTRNVCSLLNAIAPCEVTEFKDAALEYICLNLEAILQNGTIDELDEELMTDLNDIVHANQLAMLPFARSGRAEAELFERYPELAERIEKGKRAKIDAIVLSNKFADNDGRTSTSFRAQSLEDVSASPLRQRNRRKSSHQRAADEDSPVPTPKLKAKQSTDFLFEMDGDEEGDLDVSSPSSQKVSQQPSPSLRAATNPLSPSSPVIGSLDPPLPSPTPSPLTQPQGRPWGPAPAPLKKLDMRDIMAQTSNQSSILSMALNAQQSRGERPAGSFKLSQKEKKKMQQASQGSPMILTPAKKPSSTGPAPSPWSTPKSHSFNTPQPPPRATTPQLTMRQTVANPSSAKQQVKKADAPAPAPETRRSVSSPAQHLPSSTTKPPPPPATPSSPYPTTITPRSIRHTPMPDRTQSSGPQASMIAILSQQQLEKDYINTPDKRSIEEIQQEQAFQEWWDAESKKAMLEEEERRRREKRAGGGRDGRKKIQRGRAEGGAASGGGGGRKGEDGKKADASGPNPVLKGPAAKDKESEQHPRPPRAPRGDSSSRGGRGGNARGGGVGGRQYSGRGKGKEKDGAQAPSAGASSTPSAPGAS